MFRKAVISCILATAGTAAVAQADSPHTFAGNVGLFSQYIFRGLTQTDGDPSLQAGFDYSHESGLYAGTWASNISWLKENFSTAAGTAGQYDSGGSLEWDFYGGFRSTFGDSDFTYDLGLLYYWYPGSVSSGCFYGVESCPDANTLEAYGALGWKWFIAKYSVSIDDQTFGVPDSSGTFYLDLSADIPLGTTGLTLNLHWGTQQYNGQPTGQALSNDTLFSYDDWKVGLNYQLPKDFVIGAFYTDTNASPLGYGNLNEGGTYPHNTAGGTGTVFVKKSF